MVANRNPYIYRRVNLNIVKDAGVNLENKVEVFTEFTLLA